jgi:hypothetical protein
MLPVRFVLPSSIRNRIVTWMKLIALSVQIDRGRTTTVHLDGDRESSIALASPAEVVSLPDGQVVGPSAD